MLRLTYKFQQEKVVFVDEEGNGERKREKRKLETRVSIVSGPVCK